MCYSITDVDDLHALATSVRGLTAISDPELLFVRICAAVESLTRFDRTAFALVDSSQLLRVVHSRGFSESYVNTCIAAGSGMGGRAATVGQPLIMSDLEPLDSNTLLPAPGEDSPVHRLLPAGTDYEPFLVREARRAVAQPVVHGGIVIAVLYAGYGQAAAHTHEDLAMISEFAAFVAPIVASSVRWQQSTEFARVQERQRIVQHLHDTALQLIFAIDLSAKAGLHRHDLPPEVVSELENIEASAQAASHCLRDTFEQLLPVAESSVLALQELVDGFSARTGVPAQLITHGEARALPAAIHTLLISATREFLHNIDKHARASSVAVSLRFEPSELLLVIQDDGVGMPEGFTRPVIPRASCGLGLTNVGQSAALLGGNMQWLTNEDGGTTARVRVPLEGDGSHGR